MNFIEIVILIIKQVKILTALCVCILYILNYEVSTQKKYYQEQPHVLR